MKKILILFLSAILLVGCDPVVPATEDKSEEIPTPKEHAAELLIHKGETGTYIVNAEYPQLDYTEKINETIKKLIDTEVELFIEEAESLEVTAEEIEEFGWGKSGLWITYTVYLLNDDYISIAFDSSIYNSGAAHPYTYTWVFNYDLAQDKELILMDMFVPDTNFWAAISATVIPRIKDKLYEDEFVEDEWIDEGAGPEPENFTAFSITEDGFTFHFAPYQVAAYAAGPQRIEVIFEDFGAILMPEWKR